MLQDRPGLLLAALGELFWYLLIGAKRLEWDVLVAESERM